MMKLGYPGGPIIDQLAAGGDDGGIVFPRPMLKKDNFNFSFSGVKTAVLNYLHNRDQPLTAEKTAQIASAFQTAVVDVITQKTLRAASAEGLQRIVVAGGVACNSGLRRVFAERSARAGCEVYFPSPVLCADNAAMLAVAGDYYLAQGRVSDLGLNAVSNWPLESLTDDGSR
jgi:N6-L-threonylcarbamoyladenine synthase